MKTSNILRGVYRTKCFHLKFLNSSSDSAFVLGLWQNVQQNGDGSGFDIDMTKTPLKMEDLPIKRLLYLLVISIGLLHNNIYKEIV